MILLTTAEEVIMLRGKLLAATGGLPGLRDRGLLEPAVASVDADFEAVEQYPAVEEKSGAAGLCADQQPCLRGW